MLLRVAVDFAGRTEQDTRANPFGESEHIDGAHHAGLDGFDRIVLVVDRRSWAGKVKNAIDFEQNRLNSVVPDKLEAGITYEMRDVGALAAEEIIEADNLVALTQQPFT
jgi:hypothetical protein